jgi:hypothetical protein
MAQYQTGLVDVTGGSQIVNGTSTEWLANVTVGDLFKVTNIDTHYVVAAIGSNIELTLNANWAGTTLTGVGYQIVRDFTPLNDIPEIWVGDKDWPYHITTAFRMMDSLLSGIVNVTPVDHETDTEVTLISSDLNKVHLFSNTATCLITMMSVNNANIGSRIEFRKKGTGALEIYMVDSDTVMIVGGTQISNYDAASTFDFLKLLLETETHWGCDGLYGPWETS